MKMNYGFLLSWEYLRNASSDIVVRFILSEFDTLVRLVVDDKTWCEYYHFAQFKLSATL